MSEPLRRMLNDPVVLDTAGPILYIGTLTEVTEHTFVLKDADMHDCRDGHANREVYLAEARCGGFPVNRREVVVLRTVIISVSRLEDIVVDLEDAE